MGSEKMNFRAGGGGFPAGRNILPDSIIHPNVCFVKSGVWMKQAASGQGTARNGPFPAQGRPESAGFSGEIPFPEIFLPAALAETAFRCYTGYGKFLEKKGPIPMNNRTKGILCILASAFCFALMSSFVRLSGDLPSVQKSFFRNLIAAAVAFILLLREHRKGEKLAITRRQLPLLILRSVFGTVGILCNFYAVDHLVLSDASMLNKMSPFFAILASYFVLKEKLTPVQGAGVIAAFIGALFIIKPTFANMDLMPSLIGLIGGMGAGIAYTMVRALGKTGIHKSVIVFFFSAFSCLVVLPVLIAGYVPMSGGQLLCLIGAGVAAAGGQFAVTGAYCFAPAREISVYDYTQVIFSALLGFILFNQLPDGLSVAGYLIICGTGAAIFLYNRRRDRLAVSGGK